MDSLIEIIWNKESQLTVVVGWLFAFIAELQSYHFPDFQHQPNK